MLLKHLKIDFLKMMQEKNSGSLIAKVVIYKELNVHTLPGLH